MPIRQYLAPDGYVGSRCCMNEETIAGIVGWGKRIGLHRLEHHGQLPSPAMFTAAPPANMAQRTVFRTGELHAASRNARRRLRRLVATADSAKVTDNLLGERWSKLVANAMQNGLSACTGLGGGDMLKNDPIRRFATRLGSEAIRVAQGYQLEEILHLPPETIARAGEGDEEARAAPRRTAFQGCRPHRRRPAPLDGAGHAEG